MQKKYIATSTPFHDKTLNKLGIDGSYLKIIKAIYEKLTIDVILSGGRLKAFTLISETKQGCLLSPLLFSVILEVLVRAIKQEKETKVTQIGNE